MSNPTESTFDANPERLSMVIMFLTCLVLGWFGGQVAKAMPGGLLETARLAWTNQYAAMSGSATGTRNFYIVTSDRRKLQAFIDESDFIDGLDTAFLDNIAYVSISGDVTAAFNTIRQLEFVNTITSIPLFCH